MPHYVQKSKSMDRIDYDVYVEGGYREDEAFGVTAYVIVDGVTGEEFTSGNLVCHDSTSMRIFIEGAIEALKKIPFGASVRFITDTTYVVNIVNHRWRIKANGDLWEKFERVASIGSHRCCAEWRGIRTNDPILRRCWITCGKIAGFDFVKDFVRIYNEKHPSSRDEG